MRTTGTIGLLLAGLVLSGCGNDKANLRGAPSATPSSSSSPDVTRYRANLATVLEHKKDGPQLCLGVVLASLPPQCGGPQITNWEWSEVEGEERMVSTTWATYDVIGTYDRDRFTLTEPPTAPSGTEPGIPGDWDPLPSACAEPPRGTDVPDPSRADDDAQELALRHANDQPDIAAVWLTYTERPAEGHAAAGTVVINAAFTGDVERHGSELRSIWGGWLCVTRYERAKAVLEQVQEDLQDFVAELGLDMLVLGADEVRGRVELEVIHSTPEQRAQIAERFDGLVDITDALQPVG